MQSDSGWPCAICQIRDRWLADRVGYLARDYGCSARLAYIAIMALVGAMSYVFLVAPVDRPS